MGSVERQWNCCLGERERLLLVVCDYVYYHSLRFAEQKGHKSLFVHVPLFSKISEDTQMQFVVSLLEAN